MLNEEKKTTYQVFYQKGFIAAKNDSAEIDQIFLELTPEIITKTISPSLVLPPRYTLKEALSLQELKDRFDLLYKINQAMLGTEEKIIIALYKLAIMNAVKNHLKQNYVIKKSDQETQPPPVTFPLVRKALYTSLLIMGVMQDGLGSFLNGYSLLALIMTAPMPILVVGAIAFALLNTALLYSLKAVALRNALGVYSAEQNPRSLLTAHHKQIQASEEISTMLFDTNTSEPIHLANYEIYLQCAQAFQSDITNKQNLLTEYNEPLAGKLFRWMVGAFSAFMSMSGSFFIAKSLLAVIAAPLVGTPIGWTIIGLSLVSSLVFYLAQPSGISALLNPDFKEFTQVNKKLKKFKGKTEEEFQSALQNKRKHENQKAIVKKHIEQKPDLEEAKHSHAMARTQSCPIGVEFSTLFKKNQIVSHQTTAQPKGPMHAP